MRFNDSAVLVLVLLCGAMLASAFAVTGALAVGLAADAGRALASRATRVRSKWRGRNYELGKITGQ